MDTKLWIWRGVRLELPTDWELLLFSKRREAGSITFADRYRYRLQMHWREPEGEPDMKRTASDHAAKLRDVHPEAEVRQGRRGPWLGIEVTSFGEKSARFLRFFEEEGVLVECVFPAAAEPSCPVDEREVLAGVRPSEEAGRWVAFGMDFTEPEEASLETCQVQPGLASMTFCDEARLPTRHRFSRRGMLDKWLSGSVEDWMAMQVPAELDNERLEVESGSGHEVWFLTGSFREKPSGGWRKSRQNYHAAAWICPQDGRLFHEEVVGPHELREPRTLSCCVRKPGRLYG